MSTLIKNGTLVNFDGRKKADLYIENHRIMEIGESLEVKYAGKDVEVIEAEGKYILPGFIDAHTHPGLPEDLGFFKSTDDFYTEPRAALAGGTTTLFDFAEQKRGQRLVTALEERKRRYAYKSFTKYEFHVAITDVQKDIFEQMKEIKEAGVKSIKLYTTYAMKLTNEEILYIMGLAAKLELVVLLHCEEDSIIQYCSKFEEYEASRPVEAEETMVNTILNFSKITGCKVYICHVSSKETVKLIEQAKQKGIPVYLETCPQYLVLDSSKYKLSKEERSKYLLSPPLRKKEHKDGMIEAALKGQVDIISTDHCAFLFYEHKARFANDLKRAAKGIPGVQLRGSLMYDLLVEKNSMPLEDLIKMISYKPAQIFGLTDRGYIQEGFSADLVIWSREPFTVSMDMILEGTDYSPYEGMQLIGRAVECRIF